MRKLLLVTSALLAASCASSRPRPLVPDPPALAAVVPERPPDPTPRVVRRIAAEEKELVDRSLAMATELRDASGRERAMAEARALADEVAAVTRGIEGADSDALDAAITKLQLLDTRIVLLHDGLRGATERTTAVLIE